MAYEISYHIKPLFLKQFLLELMPQTQQDHKLIRMSIKIKQLYLKYPILKYPF